MTMPNKGNEVMRNFCAKCVYIVILQFVGNGTVNILNITIVAQEIG